MRENWEELVHVNKVQLVVKSEPQPDPIPQQQINPVTEEKPKKKMMRLNPNAEVFVPGGNSSQIEVQPFQPSFTPQGFYPQGQYPMGQNYMYPQQFPGQMRPPGQYPQFTPGGAPWNPGFSQEFPAYQGEGGSYVQPDMTFNTNVGAASFSRKLPLQAEEEDFDADGQPMDKEALKEQRKFRNKEKKKQAAQNDPSKPSKTKAPRNFPFILY